MRVLQVIHGLRRAGAERAAIDLSLGLAERGHQVLLCTLYRIHEYDHLLASPLGLSVERRSLLPRANTRCFLWDLPRLVRRLRRLVRIWQPDVVHCHLPTDSAVCHFVRALPRVRTIQTNRPLGGARGFGPGVRITHWLDERLLRDPSVTLVTCSQAAREALAILHNAQDRLFVVPNSVDLARFMPPRSPAIRPPCIVMVGTLEPRKNYPMALRAFQHLCQQLPEAELRILGEGSERPRLIQLCHALGIADRVHFLGSVIDIAAHLQAATAYWMTSRLEGLPIATIEAMAAGLPVVATRIAGLSQLLSPWPHLLVAVDDHVALAERTLQLLRHAPSAARLGEELRAEAQRAYGRDAMVRAYLAIYSHL